MTKLTKITHQQITATLRGAGFAAARRTKRESRSGFHVTKCSPAVVCVEWIDWQDIGDRAARFADCIATLEAAGYTLCGNPGGRRVWDRDAAIAIANRSAIIGIARRATAK